MIANGGSHELGDAADEGLERAKQGDRGMCVLLRIDIQFVNERREMRDGSGTGQEGVQTEGNCLVVVEKCARRRLLEENEGITQLLERGFIERLLTRHQWSR